MRKILTCVLTIVGAAFLSAQAATTVVHGTIKKIDSGAKTIAIATATGAQEVVEVIDKTIVHPTVVGTKDVFVGLKEGTEVVARYTVIGTKKVATELDHIGAGGLKVVEGTVTKIDAGAKTVAVKTADGAVVVFDATEGAVADVAAGAAKVGRVTVHYTEDGGKKIVHFFRKL